MATTRSLGRFRGTHDAEARPALKAVGNQRFSPRGGSASIVARPRYHSPPAGGSSPPPDASSPWDGYRFESWWAVVCRMLAIFEFESEGDGIVCERVNFDIARIQRQLGIAHDPMRLKGRLATVLNHPVTIAGRVPFGEPARASCSAPSPARAGGPLPWPPRRPPARRACRARGPPGRSPWPCPSPGRPSGRSSRLPPGWTG